MVLSADCLDAFNKYENLTLIQIASTHNNNNELFNAEKETERKVML